MSVHAGNVPSNLGNLGRYQGLKKTSISQKHDGVHMYVHENGRILYKTKQVTVIFSIVDETGLYRKTVENTMRVMIGQCMEHVVE